MRPKIFLAPMSGVTDLAFRLVSRRAGARYCFFEMLDANAMLYAHPATLRILKTVKGDSPISAQLLGSDPSVMLDAAQKLLGLADIASLDINCACPVKKAVRKGAGAALLKNRALLGRMVKRLSSGLPVPVTVKIRTGFDKRDIVECVKNARACQDGGAASVFIHGRTASQGYSGDVDYRAIRAVKKALKIPVFGSGNIFTPFLAKRMFDETGCDGILVARGALGNPWIFKAIEGYLKNGVTPEGPRLRVKKKALRAHLSYIEKYKDMAPESKAGFMGKVTTWYLKGLPEAARIRERVYKAKSRRNLMALIEGIN